MIDETFRMMSDAEMDEVERRAERRLKEARTQAPDPTIAAQVETYLRRPYCVEMRGIRSTDIWRPHQTYRGCITVGETPEAAISALRDAMATWIETAIVDGAPVPEPRGSSEGRFTGRMLLRMPKSLHRSLADHAAREDVSVNHLAVTLIAAGLERLTNQVRAR